MTRQCVECLGGWFVFRGPASPQFIQAGPFHNRETAEERAMELDMEEAQAAIEWLESLDVAEGVRLSKPETQTDTNESERQP